MSKKRKQTKGDPRKAKTVRERKEQKYGRFLHLVDGLSSNEVFCLPVAKLSPTEVQRWADALIATAEIGGGLKAAAWPRDALPPIHGIEYSSFLVLPLPCTPINPFELDATPGQFGAYFANCAQIGIDLFGYFGEVMRKASMDLEDCYELENLVDSSIHDSNNRKIFAVACVDDARNLSLELTPMLFNDAKLSRLITSDDGASWDALDLELYV